MIKIEFYSTLGCHLCDDAEELLNQYQKSSLADKNTLEIIMIDVARSDDLMELYGIRIPVLKRLDNNNELGWPFDLAMLNNFLS